MSEETVLPGVPSGEVTETVDVATPLRCQMVMRPVVVTEPHPNCGMQGVLEDPEAIKALASGAELESSDVCPQCGKRFKLVLARVQVPGLPQQLPNRHDRRAAGKLVLK